jgi:hypothetical protein
VVSFHNNLSGFSPEYQDDANLYHTADGDAHLYHTADDQGNSNSSNNTPRSAKNPPQFPQANAAGDVYAVPQKKKEKKNAKKKNAQRSASTKPSAQHAKFGAAAKTTTMSSDQNQGPTCSVSRL